MTGKLLNRLLRLILKRLSSANWEVILLMLWDKFIKIQLRKLVEKTTNDFDDKLYKGLERIIDTFLRESKEEKSLSLEERENRTKEFLDKVKDYILEKLSNIDWKLLGWTLWDNHLREILRGVIEKSNNKFDDIMFKTIDDIIELVCKPKVKKISK